MRIRTVMASRGIRGLPYKFFYGSTKEMFKMKNLVLCSPMELSSHDKFPRIHPHIHSGMKLWGKYLQLFTIQLFLISITDSFHLCYLHFVAVMNFIHRHGPQAELVVTELELIKEILNNKNGENLKREVTFYLKRLFGNGLMATSRSQKCYKLRKLANQAFHADTFRIIKF